MPCSTCAEEDGKVLTRTPQDYRFGTHLDAQPTALLSHLLLHMPPHRRIGQFEHTKIYGHTAFIAVRDAAQERVNASVNVRNHSPASCNDSKRAGSTGHSVIYGCVENMHRR